ncbi:hypothetical protein MHB40_14745 [Lysinibacillus sp. FSL K6-0057]|uniref:hypothetical protein n=1 Tax=Lysinibacillus sp. FSL K6-0057 TaxID=2921411 RepID=UPI00315B33F1
MKENYKKEVDVMDFYKIKRTNEIVRKISDWRPVAKEISKIDFSDRYALFRNKQDQILEINEKDVEEL